MHRAVGHGRAFEALGLEKLFVGRFGLMQVGHHQVGIVQLATSFQGMMLGLRCITPEIDQSIHFIVRNESSLCPYRLA